MLVKVINWNNNCVDHFVKMKRKIFLKKIKEGMYGLIFFLCNKDLWIILKKKKTLKKHNNLVINIPTYYTAQYLNTKRFCKFWYH